MSAAGEARCLLVGLTGPEQAELAAVPGAAPVDAAELEQALTAPGTPVDVVVVGSAATSPVTLVQRAHRAAPDAGVVVLTSAASAGEVRQAVAYAPSVPLDVLVLDAEAALMTELAQLREAVAQQRRHRELLAGVAARPASGTVRRPPLAVELGALLEHAPVGVLVCDAAGSVVGWNRRAGALLSLSGAPGELDLHALLPGASALLAPEREHGRRTPLPPLLLTAAGGVELEVSAATSQLDDGRPVALLLMVDVTERRAAERARDRLAGHVELLTRVSESLTSTLDTTEALDLLAAALVPDLADWVSIQLTDETGRLVLVGMRHRDPSLAEQVELARQRQLVAAAVDAPSRRVARGEAPMLLTEVDDAALERILPDDVLRSLARALGVGSVVVVPLPGRPRVLGSIVLINVPGSRPFSDFDVRVALEVGRRAGVALDNARLYAQQRDLATELQRSLLTAPPQPDHGQIVVRYVAAAHAAQVGGDWYDAFLQPDGATVLVIGDVVGHDTRAAAGMSQLRGILRGIGFTTGADPAEILGRVDSAMQGLLIETTATAVVARLEQEPADVEQGQVWLRWSNAGHPPPVLVSADGTVTVLESADADLLLGIDPTTPRSSARAVVREGDTLLLYTDGLVERRGQSLDEGLAALVDVLVDCVGLPLDELCDTALRRLLRDDPEDDVALIAVRLHPQHAPRPAEAGPNHVPPDVPPPPQPT